jgi:hypothetical protein
MKNIKLLLLTAVVLIVRAPMSSAQVGQLEMFADRNASTCVLAHTQYVESVFIFQTKGGNTTGVAYFKAPKPACWNTTWLSDVQPLAGSRVGNSQTGILDVAMGQCAPLPAFVLEIQYLAGGTSTPCCNYPLLPISVHSLVYTGCGFNEIPMTIGRSVTINPDASCPCQLPVATESSTWGRVKSLYR